MLLSSIILMIGAPYKIPLLLGSPKPSISTINSLKVPTILGDPMSTQNPKPRWSVGLSDWTKMEMAMACASDEL